jgi:probable F420-dependent oxidoreductase
MDLGRLGVWWSGAWQGDDESLDVAAELEDMGYGALWSSGGFSPGLSDQFGQLLGATDHIVVASGIVSIWTSPADEIARAVNALEGDHPGRFLLGIGASHGVIVQDYTRPFTHMVSYLDALDASTPTVPKDRRALAALGPKMLSLSAERSAGAHPYFVPVEHTARARGILGPHALLAPEVTVVLEPDPERARELARTFTATYVGLPNYANNLRTLGYGDDDFAGGGSDRLVDAVVAWGDVDAVASRLGEHYEAGADHVCAQVIAGGRGVFPLEQYRQLAKVVLGT